MSKLRIEQQQCSKWSSVRNLAIKSIKKRIIRVSMTMISVVLSIAFLIYTWTSQNIVSGLISLKDLEVNKLLMQAGINISAGDSSDKTVWLIMLSLLITSVGILNAMLMSVTERFKEIGTMKCIGATNRYIIRMFIVEAAIQGTLGTSLGVLLGFVIALIQYSFSIGGLAITSILWIELLNKFILAFVIGVGLTLVFTLYPAYTAAKMQPIEALRVEE